MEQSIRVSSNNRLRNHKRKNQEKQILIEKALYAGAYNIILFFNTNEQKIVNFLPIFSSTLKGQFGKYLTETNFKKFIVQNGNIYWGKNEDVIFPVSFLYNSTYAVTQKEEVLYVL